MVSHWSHYLYRIDIYKIRIQTRKFNQLNEKSCVRNINRRVPELKGKQQTSTTVTHDLKVVHEMGRSSTVEKVLEEIGSTEF